MKVYLDNNVISAKVKNEFPDEIDALCKLLKMFENGELELVTSELKRQDRDMSELLSLVYSPENIVAAANSFKLRSRLEYVIPD